MINQNSCDVGATRWVARTNHKAFTLIEVMVVLLIISIMAGVAVLSVMNYVRSRHLETIANKLAITIPLAAQQAVLQPAILGLQIKADSYSYYRFNINSQTNSGSWELLTNDSILKTKTIPADVNIKIETPNDAPETLYQDSKNVPQLIFLPSGDVTTFIIYLGNKGEEFSYRLESKKDGSIQVTKIRSNS